LPRGKRPVAKRASAPHTTQRCGSGQYDGARFLGELARVIELFWGFFILPSGRHELLTGFSSF
jgi:hypothetical protein